MNCSHEEAKSIIRHRLSDLEQRRWNDEVLRRPKLDFYNTIFGFKSIPLADFVSHREGCRFLCRLVGGTLPIRVESGRYSGELREERWCRLCGNSNQIEDQIHFLASCPALSDKRNEIIR